MPDLAERIRTVIDAGGPAISADEAIHRAGRGSPSQRTQRVGLQRGPAILWAVAVTLAVAATVVGLDVSKRSNTISSTTLTPATFAIGVDRVTFSYPSDWRAHQYLDDQNSFSASVVFVATQALHDPCTTIYGSHPGPIRSTSCSVAVHRLAANGVYLSWWYGGGPPRPYGSKVTGPGSPITVGGETGTIDIERPGTCTSIGGDESIDVNIGPNSNWVMEACLRGPDLDKTTAEVQALLKSTRF